MEVTAPSWDLLDAVTADVQALRSGRDDALRLAGVLCGLLVEITASTISGDDFLARVNQALVDAKSLGVIK